MSYDLSDLGVGSFPLGWWLTLDGKESYNISRDAGPGDHMGYVWSIDNASKLGLTEEDALWVEIGYAGLYYEPSNRGEWFDGDPDRESKIEKISSLSNQELEDLYLAAVQKIQSKFIRVLYDKRSQEVAFQIPSQTDSIYNAVMNFIIQLSSEYSVKKVTVEDYEDNAIWCNIDLEEVLFRRGF